ncbi:FmdB family transcriptional regulator [Arthrobacter echini]|uniref:FmdB family transcriptional regulator n=1 Tax=Arthrobacter echini TaxID=1529066 RepID=A0A4S5E294_9MICC|nr:FmdB family zinc ribbon protein [Arthrobacter echini]THJ65505.1 FmdB family transcriptional regulator [Arthrobacter echini]
MPMYAYACKQCAHAFDIQQSFSEDSLTICPECGGALRKKFDSVGVVFKGSGFYRNDSRAAAGADAGSASGAPAASGSESSTSSPAPKSADSSAAASSPAPTSAAPAAP